jgi:hypothetical protein
MIDLTAVSRSIYSAYLNTPPVLVAATIASDFIVIRRAVDSELDYLKPARLIEGVRAP